MPLVDGITRRDFRVYLTDWRNSGSWTAADLNRQADAFSVWITWKDTPPPVTFPGPKPKFYVPFSMNVETTFPQPMDDVIIAMDGHLIQGPSTRIERQFEGDAGQGWDLRRQDVREAAINEWLKTYPYADGVHFDLFCWPWCFQSHADWDEFSMDAGEVALRDPWWNGLEECIKFFKARKPHMKMLVQSGFWRPVDGSAGNDAKNAGQDGLFIERHPTVLRGQWPNGFRTIGECERNLVDFASVYGTTRDWVIDVRDIQNLPFDYVENSINMAVSLGCYVQVVDSGTFLPWDQIVDRWRIDGKFKGAMFV